MTIIIVTLLFLLLNIANSTRCRAIQSKWIDYFINADNLTHCFFDFCYCLLHLLRNCFSLPSHQRNNNNCSSFYSFYSTDYNLIILRHKVCSDHDGQLESAALSKLYYKPKFSYLFSTLSFHESEHVLTIQKMTLSTTANFFVVEG